MSEKRVEKLLRRGRRQRKRTPITAKKHNPRVDVAPELPETTQRREDAEKRARERWLGGGRLEIPGVKGIPEVDWEPPELVHASYQALRDALEPWVLGTSEIPLLRHIGNDRLVHARGRVSMAKAILAMSLLMDYRTNNVAVPIQDKKTGQWWWLGRPIQFIAKIAGISYWACKRRINDIVKHGAMTRHPQAGTNDLGEVYGRPSIRNIAMELFQGLGQKVAKAVRAAQATAYQIWREACEAVKPTVEAAKKLAEKVAEKAKGLPKPSRSPEMSALVYRTLQQMLSGYRKPKPAPS